MNPEKITTSQIYHALTPKHMVAIIAAVVTLLNAAFWLGQTKDETQSSKATAKLNSTINQLRSQLESSKNKLETAQEKIESFSSAHNDWGAEYKKAQSIISQNNQEIVRLNSALGQTNNCLFARNQIIALQREIEFVKHPL